MSDPSKQAHRHDYPRAALVTGGAQRIGRAIALDLARSGWDVAVHYLTSQDEATDVVAQIEALGRRAVALRGDLTIEEDMQRLVPDAAAALGPLGSLINNASVFEYDVVNIVSRTSWDRHLEPNLRAPFVLSQRFAEQLPEESGGLIVNLLDQRVWNLTPYFVSYTLSKSGLWTLTRTLALALAPRVRVNAIGPGPTLPSERQSDAHFTEQYTRTPLRRRVMPEEICSAVQFLLAAPAVTGQMIALDSGQHLGWAPEGGASLQE